MKTRILVVNSFISNFSVLLIKFLKFFSIFSTYVDLNVLNQKIVTEFNYKINHFLSLQSG